MPPVPTVSTGVDRVDRVGVRERRGGIGGHRLGPVHAYGVIAPPRAAVLDDRGAELDRHWIAELPQGLGESPQQNLDRPDEGVEKLGGDVALVDPVASDRLGFAAACR